MYFTYILYSENILYSEKCDRYYIGYCSDVLKRLERHNAGMVTATRNCRPYLIKATKNFSTELEARKKELRLKNKKAENILNGWLRAIGRQLDSNHFLKKSPRRIGSLD